MNAENPVGTYPDRVSDGSDSPKPQQRCSASNVDGVGPRIPELRADVDNITAGLAYVEAGLTIGPLLAGSKNPGSVLGKQWQDQTSRDPKQIAAWFTGTNHGIFIHCGPSGLVVVDVDRPEDVLPEVWQAIDQARPPVQRSRIDGDERRGHYVFSMSLDMPLSNAVGALGGGADIRAGHGVIVVAPSRHVSADGRYRWVRTGAIPALPTELAQRLAPVPPATTTPVVQADGPAFAELSATERARLRAYTADILAAELGKLDHCRDEAKPEGRGYVGPPWDSTTYNVACKLVELAESSWCPYTAEQAEADLVAHAPRENPGFTDAIVQSKLDSARTRPNAGLGRPYPPARDGLEDWDVPTRMASGAVDASQAAQAPDDADQQATGEEGEPSRPTLRAQLLSLSDLGNLPPVTPLIDGLLYRDTLAQMSGPPGSYKSFLALGMACAVAAGESTWEGHRIPEGGPVVYVAAEGASGLRARVLAWCELTNVDPAVMDGRLHFLPCPIQLGNTVDVGQAVELVREVGATLLVLDTRARCTIGLEENSATEQGRAVHAAEQIQRAAACTVLPVHHSGRAGGAGRGSNSWDGAVWSDLRVTGDSLQARIHCEKHKDVPAGCDHDFRGVQHTVSPKAMTHCTIEQRSTLVFVQSGRPDGFQAPTAPSEQSVLELIRTTAGLEGLLKSEIVSIAKEHEIGRTQAYAAISALLRGGALRNISTDAKPRYAATSSAPAVSE